MKPIIYFLPLLLAASPTTQPWSHSPTTGDTLLQPFPSAPYPHPSRAEGFHSKNGDFPKDPHYTDSTIAIVIPPGYQPSTTVDYVVHFHGWSNHVSQVVPEYKLAEQLADSHVNAILLVPQGPKDAKDSGDGKLELDEGAFKNLITEVTTFLNAQGKIHTTNIGHIALSAHSGGYKVTARVLHLGGLSDHISDVFLLDASYGNLEDFVEFSSAHPASRIISFHTQHLDDANKELEGLLDKSHLPHRALAESDLSPATLSAPGTTFISTTQSHNDVPMKKSYFSLCLSTSSLPKIKPR